jgi:BCD family chlorophyll transporter-like MFS transporter
MKFADVQRRLIQNWRGLDPRFLPFADAATKELPFGRLMRLAMFQVAVGMALALLNGTLNRVMIVELVVPAWLVSLMVSLPLVFAPFRALLGFKSDTHKSVLGWRRVPYIWWGSMLQFGGFAIMPFALVLLSGQGNAPMWMAQASAGLAFLLVGAGLHTTQTAGLALAGDLAPPEARSRVVALLYVMLLLGMVMSSLVFGFLLSDFGEVRLIRVIQGAAVVTMALNLIALWKQEVRNPAATAPDKPRPSFRESWNAFINGGRSRRLLTAVGLGSAGFSMQDILLEPYGGEILKLSVGATTSLTAISAGGALLAFAYASRNLRLGGEPNRLAAMGALTGVFAFAAVIFAAPLDSALLFRIGTGLIGFGGGLFSVGTLTAAMNLEVHDQNGLALGAWGAVQATASGVAIAIGGAMRDLFSGWAASGALGEALSEPATAYSVVYHVEMYLLFATLIAIGPLVRKRSNASGTSQAKFGLAEMPG